MGYPVYTAPSAPYYGTGYDYGSACAAASPISVAPAQHSAEMSIKQLSVYFDTTAAARRAGKEALKDLLNKLFA